MKRLVTKRLLMIALQIRVRILMLALAAFAGLASLAWGAPDRRVHPACEADRVADRIEVSGGEITLADFLPASGCPDRRQAAARVRLGRAPLAGSVRVFAGAEVQAQMNRLAAEYTAEHAAKDAAKPGAAHVAEGEDKNEDKDEDGSLQWASLSVPERITVRSRGARASCADLAKRILAGIAPGAARSSLAESAANKSIRPAPGAGSAPDVDCGAADRIPEDAPVEVIRATWDAALKTWDISAGCVHPSDCVPFLVRLRGGDQPARPALVRFALRESPAGEPVSHKAASPTGDSPLVRSGDKAILSWDRGGIRLLVPVVCLAAGTLGQTVRARIAGTGRILEATVAAPGQLRATR
jgi:Chaperone for flagella basal body P-ring formation